MGAEKNLLRRFVKGDEEAFNLLYSQYQQVIRNRIRSYTKGRLRSEIDDICQHFWLNLVRYAQSYDQTKPVENWLISCAIRSIYHYKQRNTMQEVTVTNIDAYTPTSREPNSQERTIIDEEFKIALQALGKIHPSYQKILHGICIKGKSLPEYAMSTGISIKNVYEKFDRAVKRLRKTQEAKDLIACHNS